MPFTFEASEADVKDQICKNFYPNFTSGFVSLFKNYSNENSSLPRTSSNAFKTDSFTVYGLFHLVTHANLYKGVDKFFNTFILFSYSLNESEIRQLKQHREKCYTTSEEDYIGDFQHILYKLDKKIFPKLNQYLKILRDEKQEYNSPKIIENLCDTHYQKTHKKFDSFKPVYF